MDLHLCPSLSLSLMMATIIFVLVPTTASGIDDQYLNCITPFNCSNLQSIGYPFWGGNRPEYCGYPGFELDCEGEVAEITISNITYRIPKIDNQSRKITVARDDYWDDNCPSKFVNTSLNFSLGDYAPDTKNLTLYYSCPSSVMYDVSWAQLPNQFKCSSDESNTKNYYFSPDLKSFNNSFTDAFQAYLGSCENSAIIPVWQSTLVSIVNNLNSVNLTRSLQEGFGLEWFANNSLCEECERSNGQCGYATRTGQFTCYCSDKPYSSSCGSGKGSFSRSGIYIGVAASAVGIIVILAILLCVNRRRSRKKTKENDRVLEDFLTNYQTLAPKRYRYSEVERMTRFFGNILGQGGYGDVYKGQLPDGRLVAVKVLKASKGNGEEFINEVASISRTSHVNIVTFLGFCYEKKKRALIYEFMPNGSLDRFVCDQETSSTKPKLEWRTMYQIAVGIARGLEYLHRGCTVRIVHFDIKPHNILLDEDFRPKISDFGLSKQSQKKESIISMLDARGTVGYIAPEVFCRTFGRVSHKSDVYSYGMMILEMVGGRKNVDAGMSQSSEVYFPNWIYKHIEPGRDFQFHGVVTEEEKELAKKMITVSLWCIQTNPSDRPSMTNVVEMLEGSLQNLGIPPKPSLSSPTRSAKQSSPSSWSTEIVSLE
ncbi:Receptor-like kinase [Melia azedarach]|uniref:Receptor-like kinase n=1 Tax=Melia azedarach TaxID=155640 RepID=A0ACC1X7I3_MELAZ|nr:Receptor-like kinase [Melia azedarach]